MNIPTCPTCIHWMQSHDNRQICRRNGLPATPANASRCSQYIRETGADDEMWQWVDGAWHVCGEGCGD